MQITKNIFRISSIIPCLLCLAISFAREIANFSCNFEDPKSCKWTQDKSDDFDWIRNQAYTESMGTGPLTDHTKGLGSLTNKKQGPGSIRHSGGKCIHVLFGAFERPKEGEFLVTYRGCGKDRLEFQLRPNGILMLTKYGMCVKPTGRVNDGVKVGLFSSCNATDTWSWTAQGSLQYKKKMCLRPETGGENPRNDVYLVLDSVCDEQQNVFEFVPTSGWYLFIGASQPNDTARLISPSTTETKSCLIFFYHMFGHDMAEFRVYVKSGGKMGLPVWSLSGEQGDKWYQAQVAVNNQTASYQYVIEGVRGENLRKGEFAIDDISLMDSCPARENQTSKPTSVDINGSKKVTRTFTVSTTPAISPSQTISEDKGTTDDSSRIIIIATTVGAGVFISIVLIVLLMKYKLLKRAPKLSTPVNIPLETNEISPEPLPVDEEAVYETVANVDWKFYKDVAENANESEDISVEGRASLHDWAGVPSNADKTSDNKTTVENKHLEPGNETVTRVNRGFYDDVATNANSSEDTSAEGRTSDHEEVEVPSNAHKASGHTELNKRPDTLKTGATGDGDYQARLKEDDGYVIPEKSQHETPDQNETYEEPQLSPENPVYTELDVKGRNITEHGTYQKLVKQDSDYVIPAHEIRESYQDMKMGRNLPDYEELDLRKREVDDYQKLMKT